MPTRSPQARPSAAAVWAPWLAAPLFALLPIGGCGIAGGLRLAAAHPPATTARPKVPTAPVMPVATPPDRDVAWGPPAH